MRRVLAGTIRKRPQRRRRAYWLKRHDVEPNDSVSHPASLVLVAVITRRDSWPLCSHSRHRKPICRLSGYERTLLLALANGGS